MPPETGPELLAEAKRAYAELRAVADEALAAARARLDRGELLTKPETKALNRALALARYAAHCASLVGWTPRGRRRRGPRIWHPPNS
jgi:hypothetical protein